MTVPQVRKLRKGRDYKLDMISTDESVVKAQRKYLQHTNHYTEITKLFIDGVLNYLLYKSKKPTYYRFYPIAGRLGL